MPRRSPPTGPWSRGRPKGKSIWPTLTSSTNPCRRLARRNSGGKIQLWWRVPVAPRSSRGVMGQGGNPVEPCTGSSSTAVVARGEKQEPCPHRFRRVVCRPAFLVPMAHSSSYIEVRGGLTPSVDDTEHLFSHSLRVSSERTRRSPKPTGRSMVLARIHFACA